jgi:hypothetical protein
VYDHGFPSSQFLFIADMEVYAEFRPYDIRLPIVNSRAFRKDADVTV